MQKKEKSLPVPPNTPFGRKRNFKQNGKKDPLIADQIAVAMSEGKLEEFLQRELPESKYAKKLVNIMMGMSGMLPLEGVTKAAKNTVSSSPKQATNETETIEQLIKIASDNDLSLDWLFFRALKRYIQEYQKTGNL